jgi:hypothetical protein
MNVMSNINDNNNVRSNNNSNNGWNFRAM